MHTFSHSLSHSTQVVVQRRRPVFPASPTGRCSANRDYESLAVSCWSHDPPQRPSFEEVVAMLNKMLPQVSCLLLAPRAFCADVWECDPHADS